MIGRDALGAVVVTRADLTSDVARELITALNAELAAEYPEPGATHFRLDPAEVDAGNGVFLVAHLDGAPVGCGAVRRLRGEQIERGVGSATGEVKRMYVAPQARRRGVARALLARLEDEARTLGLTRIVLETGVRSNDALALYRGSGFTDIPAYGEYVLSPATSVCLGKTLTS